MRPVIATLLLGFCLFLQINVAGQGVSSDNQSRKLMYTVGLSVGRETFIGAPRFGLYKPIKLSSADKHFRYANKHTPIVYAGVEGSVFVFFGGVFSIAPSIGFGFGHFTVDNNLAFTIVTSPDNVRQNYLTYNPKVGVALGPIWLKCGPGILVNGEDHWGAWMKVGRARMNVEILYWLR